MSRLLPFFIFLLGVANTAAQDIVVTAVYQPDYQLASELRDTLNPLFNPQASLVSDDKRLIIRGDESTVRQIEELLRLMDHPARVFFIEIRSGYDPANHHNFSTKNRSKIPERFSVTENTELKLTTAQYTQNVDAIGPLWIDVDSVADNTESLQIKLKAAKQHIFINFKLRFMLNGKLQLVEKVVTGPLNHWLALGSEPQALQPGDRKWSSDRNDIDHLYIRVTAAN